MKKQYLYISIFVFSALNSNADRPSYFPLNIGYVWEYSDSLKYDTLSFNCISDTSINNRQYYKLLMYNWYFTEEPTFWRIQNDSVYFYDVDNIEEHLIYDFTASVGDTWFVDIVDPHMYCCLGGLIELQSTNDTVTINDNIYTNCYRFRRYTGCSDIGYTLEWFTPGIGRIMAYESSILGVRIIKLTNYSSPTFIKQNKNHTIYNFNVSQNYPNPFNNSTFFEIDVPENGNLRLQIFEVSGKKVYEQNIGDISATVHKVHWNGLTNNGTEISSGVYFYRFLFTGKSGMKNIQTKKLMLLR